MPDIRLERDDKLLLTILSKMAKECNVDFNIHAGGVQHLTDKDIGVLYVDIDGNPEEVSKAIKFLEAEKVIVEGVK